MPTLTNRYLGQLRTTAKHIQSGESIITDAPTDNMGKGEAFSPTDLVACALASCMITTMGIIAEPEQIDMTGIHTKVTKVMIADPRRISEVKIEMFWENCLATSLQIKKLKNAALTCPVALSLHPELSQQVNFHF